MDTYNISMFEEYPDLLSIADIKKALDIGRIGLFVDLISWLCYNSFVTMHSPSNNTIVQTSDGAGHDICTLTISYCSKNVSLSYCNGGFFY